MFRSHTRNVINKILSFMGAKLVNTNWGPRGFAVSLKDFKSGGFTPSLVLDIGAYDGIWTKEALGIFPESPYFLVDPLPKNKSSLEALKKSNSKIDYWMGAVGAMSGHIDINQHSDQSSVFASQEYEGDVLKVPMETLDKLLLDRSPNGNVLLKADIQGAELEMLRGASVTLKACELILLELSIRPIYDGAPLADEIIAFLSEQGFCLIDICTYSQRPRDNKLSQVDAMFIRKDSPLIGAPGWN